MLTMASILKNKKTSFYSDEDEESSTQSVNIDNSAYSKINRSEFDEYKRDFKYLLNDQKFEDLNPVHLKKMIQVLKGAEKRKNQELTKKKMGTIINSVYSIVQEIFSE